jgi:hypothetical protein
MEKAGIRTYLISGVVSLESKKWRWAGVGRRYLPNGAHHSNGATNLAPESDIAFFLLKSSV